MITASLTAERLHLPDGSTAYPYEWNGETVEVRDSALIVLKILELYRDTERETNDKGQEIINLMFVDPQSAWLTCDYDPSQFAELIKAVDLDVYGLDLDGKHTEPPLWDIEQDAEVIRTSFRLAYDLDWDQTRNVISWAEMIALIGSLPYETPLGYRIYYRNAKNRPKRDKHNRKQVAEFDRLHQLYKLTDKRKGSQDRITASQHAMDDLALAMRKGK